MAGPLPDPLLEPRPDVDEQGAAQLLADAYRLEGTLTPLHGERDRNFCLDTGSTRFVVKIHNPADRADVVEMRACALEHVRRVDPALPVPSVVPSIAGAGHTTLTARDGRTSEVQLFTFLEGHHPSGDELDDRLVSTWGRTSARLGRALRGFFHPAAGYPIQWDVRRAGDLAGRISLLDPRGRGLVADVLARFEREVAPKLDGLRAQVIHGDLGPGNVLFGAAGQVSGITDFGDTTHTVLLADLAVVLAEVLQGCPRALDLVEPLVAGYASVTPLEESESALLFDLTAARVATEVVITTWRRATHPHITDEPDGALTLLEHFSELGADHLAERFRRACHRPVAHALPYGRRATPELRSARARVMGTLELSYDEPLHLVRGEGTSVFDAAGRRYLDAYNNVPVAGHCHPKVAEAIGAQAAALVTNTRYLTDAAVSLGEQLLARAPAGLERVLFVSSGSEANDVAWQIARFATGRRGALVTEFAYHGVTEATAALSPEEWPPGRGAPGTGVLPPPTGPGPADEAGTAEAVRAVGSFAHGPTPPAALFVDPAFTSDGILGPAPAWMAAVVEAVREAGGLVVGDEVQAGYGRTGAHLWSIVASGVAPDLMTLGKPMGNGFPVAAVLGRGELVDPFLAETGYFSTFGGNSLACAAALATLDVVESEDLVARAAAVGTVLRARLVEVASNHPSAGALRGWGLMLGLDIVDPDGAPDAGLAGRLVNRMRDLGVLVGTTGRSGAVLKIRPPLVFSADDAEQLADCLTSALGTPAGSPAGSPTRRTPPHSPTG